MFTASAFFSFSEVSINLSSVGTSMLKEHAHSIDVYPSCQGHCGKGVVKSAGIKHLFDTANICYLLEI